MAKEHGDDLLSKMFPRARFIDRIESIVLQEGNDAIHVYPREFTLDHITLYQAHTEELAGMVEQADTRVAVAGQQIPVRINRIRSIHTLPDNRVFTRSRYAGPFSLDTCLGKWGLPRWFNNAKPSHKLIRELDIAIDKAVVHDVGYPNIPNEFELATKNIHIERGGFTIVDIAAILERIW